MAGQTRRYRGNTVIDRLTSGQLDILSGQRVKFLADGDGLLDKNGNLILEEIAAASAVNNLRITNAATGVYPAVDARGTDTNIGILYKAKGAAPHIFINGKIADFLVLTTIGDVAGRTVADAELLGGLYVRNSTSGPYTDTTRTAAQIVASVPGAAVGTSWFWILKNSPGATTLTLAGGTGVTVSGTATVASANAKIFLVYLANVTGGSEAVTIYSVGTLTF